MKILITGTSSGLGFGLANYYLQQNHTVYGISRRPNSELGNFKNFSFLSQDLSDFEETEKNIAAFLKDTDSLDLVILNAGMLNEIKDMKDTSLEEIKKVMDVNVWSNKVIIDTLFSVLRTIGQVVAISSGASVSGARGWNAYSLSKAALNMLISLYANEQAQTHFCALAPGLINTGMQAYISGVSDELNFPTIERLRKVRESGEMPTIEEAAQINAQAIGRLKQYDSGSFIDVRKL
jgi:NAD(P)-dependent dehydrogenase (short-subunit alcohol dehydrogenase family)